MFLVDLRSPNFDFRFRGARGAGAPPKKVPKIEVHGTYPYMVSSKHSGTPHPNNFCAPSRKSTHALEGLRWPLSWARCTVQSKKQNWNDDSHNREVSRQCTDRYLQCKQDAVLNITGSYKHKQLIQQLVRGLEITVKNTQTIKTNGKLLTYKLVKDVSCDYFSIELGVL